MRLESIHVLLVALPGVLRGIIQGVLEQQPDVIVVGNLHDPRELPEALARSRADLVIWGVDGDGLDRYASLFDEHPRLRIVAIEHDGRRGFVWQLRPHRTVLGKISPARLAATIRLAARS
jgi:DNA-binding NarL/FixJ family response regulator